MGKARTCKRFLSILLACALAPMMLPATAFATTEGDEGGSLSPANATESASITERTTTLESGSYVLSDNVTLEQGALTVPSGANVTLNLAGGATLTNKDGDHTIVVENGGTLTITGPGKVDNVSHGKGAILNNGCVILEGGVYDRSAENGTSDSNSGKNSWYTICNHGTMTVYEGVTVTTAGGGENLGTKGRFSSLVENGYQDFDSNNADTGYVSGTNAENPKLTIYGGNFKGGLNTIKNDDNGDVEINGGSFSNFYQCLVMNHNVAAITGGTFTAAADSPEKTTYGIYNCGCDANHDHGTLTVSGGSFVGTDYGIGDVSDTQPAVTISGNVSISAKKSAVASSGNANISISGGTFSSDVSDYVPIGYKCTANTMDGSTTYTVGAYGEGELEVKPDASVDAGTTSATLDGVYSSDATDITYPSGSGSADVPSGEVANNNVAVTLPTVNDATTASLNVAGATVSSLASNSGSLTITSNVGTMEVSNAALQTISGNAEGGAVTLSMEKKSSDQNTATYELTATAGVKDVFTESSGTIKVSVPAPSGVNAGNVKVYYLGSNGAELVQGATVEGANVVWTVNHFSTYYITADEQKVSVTNENGTTTYADFGSALTAVSSATGDVTINLLDDVNMTTKATISNNVTINGNGHTITGMAGNAGVNFEVANGTFAINNVTLDGFGSEAGTDSGIAVIKVPNTAAAATNVVATDVNVTNFCRSAYDIRSGSFEITGGTINSGTQGDGENSRLTKGIMAGYGTNKVTGTIANVDITNAASNYSDWSSAGIEIYQNADVTVSGCTISNVQNGISVDNYYPAGNSANTTANAVIQNTNITAVNNAVIVMGKDSSAPGTASASVSGGTLTGAVKIQDGTSDNGTNKETVSLSGTTVNGAVINEGGSMGINDAKVTGTVSNIGSDATMGIVGSNVGTVTGNVESVTYVNATVNGQPAADTAVSNAEAMVNGKTYGTLAEAVTAARNGDIVTLLQDVTLDGTSKANTDGILLINGKNITLDGNGKTIKAENVTVEQNTVDGPSMINIQGGANVTVKNLTIDGKEVGDGATDNTKHGLNVYGPGTAVTVENLTIKNGNGYAIVANGSTATINGLTTENNGWGGINVDSKSAAAKLTINNATVKEANSVKIENSADSYDDPVTEIKGGYFQYVTLGESINENEYKGLTISGGKFATGSYNEAVNVSKYLAPGLALDGNGNVYTPSTGGGSAPAAKEYAVTVSTSEHGKVTADPAKAAEGKTVTLTVEPDEGYKLTAISAVDAEGAEVELAAGTDGTYSFAMPASEVKVSATFACDGGELCPSHGFSDVDPGKWYHATIDWAVSNKVLHGIGGTDLMMPDGEVTRAQMAAILYNVAGNPEATYDGEFSDVREGDWFADAIAWARSEGLFYGYEGTGLFGPDDVLTREQAAAVLMRWSALRGDDTSARTDLSDFPDSAEVSGWASEAMSWAVAEGVLNGVEMEDGSRELQPLGTATRAQAAALMMNLVEGDAK